MKLRVLCRDELRRAVSMAQAIEVTIFKSVGNAVQDVAVATKALEEARKHSLGVELEI